MDDPAETREASDPGRHVAIVGRSVMNSSYSVVRSGGASSWLLAWTLDGSGRLTHDGVTVDAVRHDLVLLGSNVRQRYGTHGDRWDFAWFHFQPRPAWPALVGPWSVGRDVYRTHVTERDDAVRIGVVFDRAFDDLRPGTHAHLTELRELDDPPSDAGRQTIRVSPAATAELVLNAIEEILLVAARGGQRASGVEPERLGPIEAAERAIVTDPAAAHTVASLAAIAVMSPSHFAHEFRRRRGRTPMQAVRDERLNLAVQLLRVTDLQVTQVAKAVGYPDPYYFSRLFRAQLGIPPSTYAAAAVDNHRYSTGDQ